MLGAPSGPALESFWGDVGAQWGNIRTFWGTIDANPLTAATGLPTVAGQLQGLVGSSQATWGAAVQAQTGKSFMDGFATPLLNKYGIDLNNPQSLAGLDPNTREHFMIDWYDGLMNFSGMDHVDHWMREVNWSPALTQTLGSGASTTIGLLDFSVTGVTATNVTQIGGVSTIANGHGTAVASLMVDPIDGKGVMGIAPEASVVAYNPFDATQTAGWSDITNGVKALAAAKANVINMSLGVPGWTFHPNWNQVFADPTVQKIAQQSIFVIAAGNDGVVQSTSFVWNNHNPSILIVGSVDPTGTISSFSNQPGTACLLAGDGTCQGDYLMNHFIVAPGEMILVSDGQGGVTRYSGTSFAAPLVSGTIALIQDRWPWLKGKPADVTNIVLKSARDLGAPGIDPVYGVGELDVLAALSPLDYNKLTFKIMQNGKLADVNATQLRSTTAAQRALWEINGVYVSAFEKTISSQRDFEIPLSSRLANQTVSVQGSQEQFMGYLTSRFSTWLGAPTQLADGSLRAGFTDLTGAETPLSGFGDARASLSLKIRGNRQGFRNTGVPLDSEFALVSADQRLGFAFGSGDRAASVAGQTGFTLTSDYDVLNGGANPFLGFASGDTFGRAEYKLTPRLSVSTGFTQRTLKLDLQDLPVAARQAWSALAPYAAQAENVTVKYALSPKLHANLGYTQLHEDHALLGTESTSATDLPDGATTDAVTAGADFVVTPTVSLAATGTMGRTRAGDPTRSAIAIGRAGLMSSAYQVALTKAHLFDRQDNLRLSFAQPMHVERGNVDVTTIGVVDRSTGELGDITQTAPLVGAPRRYVGELIYGRSMMNGTADMRLFGRATLGNADRAVYPALTMGGSVRLQF